MSADGHMRAWVVAAQKALFRGDYDAARDYLDRALAGPCTAETCRDTERPEPPPMPEHWKGVNDGTD